jgi:hypothetical protein
MALVKVCDMHDLTEWWVEVEATRSFEIDGRRYEIDLCADDSAALDQVLAPYIEHGRRSKRR